MRRERTVTGGIARISAWVAGAKSVTDTICVTRALVSPNTRAAWAR